MGPELAEQASKKAAGLWISPDVAGVDVLAFSWLLSSFFLVWDGGQGLQHDGHEFLRVLLYTLLDLRLTDGRGSL